jgi:hypothetical protein
MVTKLFFLFFFPVALMTVQVSALAGSPKEVRSAKPCIEEVRIGKATNPFRALDSRGAGPEGKSVRVVDLKGRDFHAIDSLGRYAVSGRILMGIYRKTQEPVLSSEYFSPLARVDATRIEPGQVKEIGTLLNALASPLNFRDVVLFLLESQIITTYWHIESLLCLVSEDDSADLYKAHFQGIHVYYTNKYNEEKLDFSISIKKNSGRMLLLGGG